MLKVIMEATGGNGKIKLFFDLSYHGSKEDARRLEPILRDFKPHVVCFEQTLSSRESARRQQSLITSTRFGVTGDHPQHNFVREMHRLFRKHNIRRAFVLERASHDVSNEIGKKQKQSAELGDRAIALFFNGNSTAAIKVFRKSVELDALTVRKREHSAKRVISNLYAELIKEFPELAHEGEIRVAVKYGVMHTALYKHALQSGFKDVRRIVRPTVFDLESAHVRSVLFGLNPPQTDQDTARLIVSSLIMSQGNRLGVSPDRMDRYSNAIALGVTLAQFRRISKKLAEKQAPTIVSAFRSEGIPFPETKKEINDFLSKRKQLVPENWRERIAEKLKLIGLKRR